MTLEVGDENERDLSRIYALEVPNIFDQDAN